MAIRELFPVIIDEYEVDPDWDFDVDGRVIAGSVVALQSSGTNVYIKLCTTSDEPIGLAADSLTDRAPTSDSDIQRPYQDNVIVNRQGATQYTSNRVADFYNETKASGKMSVYHGGGTFATNQYDTADSLLVGDKLYSNVDGDVSKVNAGSQTVVAVVVKPVGAIESGVPGTDISGSISLGNFLTLQLRI